jgi:Peptidase S24-like
VRGESTRDAGLLPGDTVVVKRGAIPAIRDIVVAAIGGDVTVKQLAQEEGGAPYLKQALASASRPSRVVSGRHLGGGIWEADAQTAVPSWAAELVARDQLRPFFLSALQRLSGALTRGGLKPFGGAATRHWQRPQYSRGITSPPSRQMKTF